MEEEEAAMPGPGRNLELKAVDPDPASTLRACEALGAEDGGLLAQKDTYFAVPRGRLKLREEAGAVAHLIAYERPDRPDQKESRYELVEVADAAGLERALAGALGIVAVVRKTRRLFLLEGVRIHLDRVEGLGDFIELEGVAGPRDADLSRFEALLGDLRASLGIADGDLVPGSYCDLLSGPASAVP